MIAFRPPRPDWERERGGVVRGHWPRPTLALNPLSAQLNLVGSFPLSYMSPPCPGPAPADVSRPPPFPTGSGRVGPYRPGIETGGSYHWGGRPACHVYAVFKDSTVGVGHHGDHTPSGSLVIEKNRVGTLFFAGEHQAKPREKIGKMGERYMDGVDGKKWGWNRK